MDTISRKYFTQEEFRAQRMDFARDENRVNVIGQDLEIKMSAHGKYRGIRFKINAPIGGIGFTYYVYLFERMFRNKEDYNSIWLEPEVTKYGTKLYNYNDTWISGIEFHCGVTFYRRHDDSGCVEVGCDYSHYWDEEQIYVLADVVNDVHSTIDSLYASGKLIEDKKEESPHD